MCYTDIEDILGQPSLNEQFPSWTLLHWSRLLGTYLRSFPRSYTQLKLMIASSLMVSWDAPSTPGLLGS
jgi:hypothetical protein